MLAQRNASPFARSQAPAWEHVLEVHASSGNFIDEFLQQQDAYIPDLAVAEHVVNEDLVVEVKDLAPDDIERVDYLAFQ